MHGRVAFFALGCKLNSYETESLRGVFYRHRYDIVDFDQPADYYVINTCAVTGHAEADARQLIRPVTKRNPSARVIVTGCYAQRDGKTLAAMPEVALVVGNAEKSKRFQLFEDSLDTPDTGEKVFTSHPFKGQPTEKFTFGAGGDTASISPFTRATIKVKTAATTSARFVSFRICAAQVSVGPLPPSSIMYVPLPLRAIRRSTSPASIPGPMGWISKLPPRCWRCSNSSSGWMGSSAFDWTRLSPPRSARTYWICRGLPEDLQHLHICLQSGDDDILRRMRRHYDVASYERLIAKVMERMPECGLGSDLLVGFPGETEAHFERTLRVVERLPFSYLHVFSYSARPGTPATKYPGQVHPSATKERSRRLRELGQAKKKVFARQFIGQELTILLEGKRDKARQFLSGLTEHYIRVHVDAPEASVNQLVPVRLVALAEDEVLGEWLGGDGVAVDPVKRVNAAIDADLRTFQ